MHPTLLPIEHAADNARQIKIQYELPSDVHVSISLLDTAENTLEQYLDKDQKAGNYFIKKELPEGQQFFLLFQSTDSKILRRIVIR